MEETNEKNELAKKRTDLAVQRTVLANARTFSAWIRTGLSSVLAGLAIVKFIENEGAFHGYVLLIGILFVLIGIAIYLFAFISFKESYDKLGKDNKKKTSPLFFLIAITTGMVLTAVLIIGLLLSYQ